MIRLCIQHSPCIRSGYVRVPVDEHVNHCQSLTSDDVVEAMSLFSKTKTRGFAPRPV